MKLAIASIMTAAMLVCLECVASTTDTQLLVVFQAPYRNRISLIWPRIHSELPFDLTR